MLNFSQSGIGKRVILLYIVLLFYLKLCKAGSEDQIQPNSFNSINTANNNGKVNFENLQHASSITYPRVTGVGVGGGYSSSAKHHQNYASSYPVAVGENGYNHQDSYGTSYGRPLYSNHGTYVLEDEEFDADLGSILSFAGALGLKKIKKFKGWKALKVALGLKALPVILLPALFALCLALLLPLLIPLLILAAFFLPIPVITIPNGIGRELNNNEPRAKSKSILSETAVGKKYSSSMKSVLLAKNVLESQECLENIFCQIEKREEEMESKNKKEALEDWFYESIENSSNRTNLKSRIIKISSEGRLGDCSAFICDQIDSVLNFNWI